MPETRDDVQKMVRADKWIAGRAQEQGNVHVADQAQARADEGVEKLLHGK